MWYCVCAFLSGMSGYGSVQIAKVLCRACADAWGSVELRDLRILEVAGMQRFAQGVTQLGSQPDCVDLYARNIALHIAVIMDIYSSGVRSDNRMSMVICMP